MHCGNVLFGTFSCDTRDLQSTKGLVINAPAAYICCGAVDAQYVTALVRLDVQQRLPMAVLACSNTVGSRVIV